MRYLPNPNQVFLFAFFDYVLQESIRGGLGANMNGLLDLLTMLTL